MGPNRRFAIVSKAAQLRFHAATYSALGSFEYAFVSNLASWPEAHAACLADGGDLASIHSRAENEFIYNLAPTPYLSRWIGASLVRTSSPQVSPFTWIWSDGTPFDIFTNATNGYSSSATCARTADPTQCLFSVGEPNDNIGFGPDCLRVGITPASGAMTSKALPFEWNDAGCSLKAGFVCKRVAGSGLQ